MPTLNYKCGVIKTLPDIRCGNARTIATALACVTIAQHDWSTTEASWDFMRHPIV